MSGRRDNCAPKTVAASAREVPVKVNQTGLRLAGVGLIVFGLILVFLAVPFWLWAMLLGIVLILVGFFLIIGD